MEATIIKTTPILALVVMLLTFLVSACSAAGAGPSAVEQAANTPIPSATATPVAPSEEQTLLQTSTGWQTLLNDSFDTNANQWDTTGGKQVANGKYSWDIGNKVNIYRGLPNMDKLSDFAASLDAKFVGGSSECAYGITFRNSTHADSMQDYVFYIYDDQRWGFDIIHHPDPGIAMDGTSPAIHSGGVNRISVIAQDTHYSFFVNDAYVGQVDDRTLASGSVGAAVWVLGKDKGCQVEFDNYSLRVPPQPATSGGQGKVILSGFDTANSAKFPTGEYAERTISGKREIEGNTYHWLAQDRAGSEYQFAIPPMSPVTNFTASVTGRLVNGPERAAYGFVLRHADPDSEYVFTVTGFGDYDFSLTQAGKFNALFYPTKSAAIKNGEANRLKVVAQGPKFQFYINDKKVDEINDAALTGGTVGLLTEVYEGGQQAQFEFSDFELREP